MSTTAFGQVPSTTFSADLLGSYLLPSMGTTWSRYSTGTPVNKGDPPRRGDNPDGPKDPRGH